MERDLRFFAPTGDGVFELTEKRSRFIALCFSAQTEDGFRARLTEIRAKHRDARHNVWAYVLPDGTERSSDDGEPSGTAGAPILEMLRRENVRGCAVIVTRYFGGVLLGTGGLARAYTAAAKGALEVSNLRLYVTKHRVSVAVPYSIAAKVKFEITSLGGTVESADYAENVTFTALFDAERVGAFTERVRELTAGASEVINCGIATVGVDGDIDP
jgi:uncharacterized YigZ family protein